MTDFDFFVIVMAIPLGLALVEIAQGISIMLRRRHEIEIGILTPLLAVSVLMGVGGAWMQLWDAQDQVAVSDRVIHLGVFLGVIYYVTASFVFPDNPPPGIRLDDWFWKNRIYSLGGTFLILVLVRITQGTAFPSFPADKSVLNQIGYGIGWATRPMLILVAVFARRKWVVMLALAALVAGSAYSLV